MIKRKENIKKFLFLYVFLFLFLFLFFTACDQSEDESVDQSGNKNDKLNNFVTLNNGLLSQIIQHNDIERRFLLYIPSSYDGGTAVPVLFNFHGYSGTAVSQLMTSDMRGLAETHNVILIYPQGTEMEGVPFSTHWNPGLKSDTNKSSADDFGFIEELISTMSATYNIDLNRLYATGYSNGGFFSYALACYRSHLFAAIGAVASTMLEETYTNCNPSHPTGLILIHGTQDTVVRVVGSAGLKSISDVITYWTEFNKTDTNFHLTKNYSENIERYKYESGTMDVSIHYYKVIGGGHVWDDNVLFNGKRMSQLIFDFLVTYDKTGKR